MVVRVNVKTDGVPQTYLIDTEELPEGNTKSAIEYVLSGAGEKKQFGPRIEVNRYGEIIQDGYEMNEDLSEASINDDTPEIYAITNY